MRPLRVFVDTSVFGGMFDAEFREDTRVFFQAVDAGVFQIAISKPVADEIEPAPERVKAFFKAYLPKMDMHLNSPNVQRLTDLYLQNGIVTPKYRNDASFVACATAFACAGLVSWNFTHIVHEDKSRLFNVVNLSQGYPQLFIVSPKEVMRYAQER